MKQQRTDMKEIKLSQQGKNKGKFVALVDDSDFEVLSQFRWCANAARKRGYYAVRTFKLNGISKNVYMHRLIMKAPFDKVVDHINHNGLDNRRANLKICTITENNNNPMPREMRLYLMENKFGEKKVRAIYK